MKRTSIIFIALTVICMMTVMLTGCSKTTEATEAATSAPTEAATEITTQATTDAATEAETEAPTEAETSPLVGSWEYDEVEGFIYTFNADGTGTYDVLGEIMNFTYTDKSGSVDIMYEDVDEPYTAEYTIEGNTLIMKDSLGVDVKYIKK